MRWKTRTLAIAGAAVAVATGAVGAALATTGSSNPKAAATAFVHDVATRLGVSDEKLTTALKDASSARVDRALKDGKITKEQADEMKARIQSGDAPLLLGPARPGEHMGLGRHGMRANLLGSAATYLGKTEAELRTALESGKSLAEVAKDAGKSTDGLKAAISAGTKTELDKQVAAGTLTAEQAKAMLARMTSKLDDLIAGKRPDGGDFRGHHGFGGPGHHGPGPGGSGAFFTPTAAQPA